MIATTISRNIQRDKRIEHRLFMVNVSVIDKSHYKTGDVCGVK